MKRKVIKADEYDAISGWRRYLRAPDLSKIKRRMRRRERHDAARDLRRGIE